ncbi:MAG: OmpH family outer membrane protein [candidate division KSB1 bacterium]|nr:OmpH family outer membrane protein [candidate division KSB1 bacterium]
MRTTRVASTVLMFVAAGLMGQGPRAQAQAVKLGYVDSQRILAEFKEAQDAQKKLDDIIAQWQQERQQMQRQLQDMQEQYQKQSLLLSEERKREREQEMQQLYTRLMEYDNQKFGAQGEVYQKQAELFEPVFQKIRDAIAKIGKQGGFAYIFDIASNAVLYKAEDQPDLTDEVLAELNKGVTTSGKSSR